MFVLMICRPSLNIGHVGSKKIKKAQGQIEGKYQACVTPGTLIKLSGTDLLYLGKA